MLASRTDHCWRGLVRLGAVAPCWLSLRRRARRRLHDGARLVRNRPPPHNGGMANAHPVFDIAVVGAGAVGLALAAALKREAAIPLKVALIAPPAAPEARLRTVALSPGSQ